MKRKSHRKKGSGRKDGSFSFVNIPLADIMSKLGSDTSTPVTVGRKWAQSLGFKGLVSRPANAIHNAIEGQTPETKVATKVVDFDKS